MLSTDPLEAAWADVHHQQLKAVHPRAVLGMQDKINSLTLSGPHRLSSNDVLSAILWHVICLVRDRTDSAGTFYLPFDLRQMHVPDAYFGNAHCMLSVLGELPTTELMCMFIWALIWLRQATCQLPGSACYFTCRQASSVWFKEVAALKA